MELHGNARLTPHGRTLMCQRVRRRGLDGRRGRRGGWLLGTDLLPVAGPLRRRRGDDGSLLGAARGAGAHPAGDRGAHRAAPAAAVDLDPDRRRARPGDLDGLRGAPPPGPAPPVSAGATGTAEPLLPAPPRRADPHRHQEARPVRPSWPARSPPPGRLPGHLPSRAGTYVHVAVDDTSRLAYVEILDDETRRHLRRVPPTGHRLVRHPRRHRRAGHDRQRHRLPLQGPRRRRRRAARSSTSAPGPTGPAPTARPSGSSRPSRSSGPTPPATRTTTNAPTRSDPGSSTTTAGDHTAPSATSRPPAASPRLTNAPGIYS